MCLHCKTSETFPQVTPEEFNGLHQGILDRDIKDVLFHIGTYKALCSDGYPMHFYKKFWALCQREVHVRQLFSSGELPTFLKHTLLT